MTTTHARHLVLDLTHTGGNDLAVLACSDGSEPFDQARHTLLAALTTCPACRAVQAARIVVIDAATECAP